ncbi:FMN-binding negative transcriptional regulator [Peredibacter starrii]|uniref:FMN-binding negative transcriptional regulator n=1 Tax=Peredibacter starrii TaxID=28202 RepID=A0AAX4HTD0_9BACT|nr:FMN-binding negative transcriptional regulator [Peredibacter starrii]WPU66225.1 FMN-binding negative transcriptional regulator [Peredibacter starrii]
MSTIKKVTSAGESDKTLTMYNPKHFINDNIDELNSLIDQYPFATLITGEEVGHLPLYREGNKLVGHMARRNQLKLGEKVKVVFNGPQTYINSSWYAKNDVPTWNYAVVHIDGNLKLIEDNKGILKILNFSNDHMNQQYEEKWDMYVPEDLRGEQLSKAIVGIEISIDNIEGKFKLSQNRNDADYAGVLEGLSRREDEMSQKIRQLMTRPQPR